MIEKSQINDVINHLRKYKSITSLEAIKKYGATRLSGIIYVLRDRGFVISTEIIYKKKQVWKYDTLCSLSSHRR